MSLRLRLGVVDGSPMQIINQEFIGSSSSLRDLYRSIFSQFPLSP